jgi:hypothetical protein
MSVTNSVAPSGHKGAKIGWRKAQNLQASSMADLSI